MTTPRKAPPQHPKFAEAIRLWNVGFLNNETGNYQTVQAVKTLAKMLGLDPHTVRNWRDDGWLQLRASEAPSVEADLERYLPATQANGELVLEPLIPLAERDGYTPVEIELSSEQSFGDGQLVSSEPIKTVAYVPNEFAGSLQNSDPRQFKTRRYSLQLLGNEDKAVPAIPITVQRKSEDIADDIDLWRMETALMARRAALEALYELDALLRVGAIAMPHTEAAIGVAQKAIGMAEKLHAFEKPKMKGTSLSKDVQSDLKQRMNAMLEAAKRSSAN